MTRKAEFDAEQWTTLASAPALAAMAVAAADRGGTLREGVSMARAYQQSRREEHSELIGALLVSPPDFGATPPADPGELHDRALAAVRAAAALLTEKATPDELREFGDFVLSVCDTVARAHKEGGMLGMGGKEVSALEQGVLDQIATELEPRPEH